MIPTFSLESSRAPTELCFLGAKCQTDKSPFNPQGHRHPYTPFYSMFLATYKNKPVRFVEIGVAGGASVHMWCNYFKNGELFFYDRDENFLQNAAGFGYANAKFGNMDVRSAESIRSNLAATGGALDVILDDSSHDVWDQKIIVETALPFLKPGGILLIEDVFRNVTVADYLKVLEPVKDQLAFHGFIEMEHINKFSPGWDNDKILMLVKT
jgi:predicted O-methyltransferase YrrM